MFRKFMYLSVGTLALLLALGAPSQLHAQHRGGGMRGSTPSMRGSASMRNQSSFRGASMSRPRFDPRFNPGFDHHMFDHRFNRGFDDRRFDNHFNNGFFDPRFHHGPGPVQVPNSPSSPGFRPSFFRP